MVTVVEPGAAAGHDRRRGPSWPTVLLVAVGVAVGVAIVAVQTASPSGLLDLRIYLGAAATPGAARYEFEDPVFGLGSTYPPLWSVLLRPVVGLDVHLAEYAWTLVGLALWGRALWVLAGGRRRVPGVSGPALAGLWLATLATAPVWNSLNQGQINLLLWCLIAVDLDGIVRTGRGGVRLGIAAALKLTPAAVGVLLLTARRVRPALVAGATALAVTALAWAADPDASHRYWTEVLFDTDRVGVVEDPQNASLAGLVARLHPGGDVWAQVALVLGVVVVLVLAGRGFRRAIAAGAPIGAATVAGATMALVAPIAWTHHLVFACFPLLLLLGRRTLAARAGLVAGWLVLVDPVGWGRLGATSSLRAVGLVVLLVVAPRLVQAEVAWRHPAQTPAGVCDAVPRGR